MAKLGKWIGAGLGWSVLGPMGAIVGFFVGTLFDEADVRQWSQQKPASDTRRGDFNMSLLVLIAEVMKADGTVRKSELLFVQENLKRNFGIQAAREASILLRDLLKKQVPVTDVCKQIARNVDYASRLQILHFLYGISAADGVTNEREIQVIEKIAYYIGLSQQDIRSVKSMFVKNTDSAYHTLGVERNAPTDEIKRAYREMAKKFHPDKLNHLGEDVRKSAEEKFQKINQAFEQIKKERNFK